MPERSSNKKGSANPGLSQAASEMGKVGGKRGGPARAESLSAAERSKIAKQAAEKRWQQGKGKK